jgi:hypothetical protein
MYTVYTSIYKNMFPFVDLETVLIIQTYCTFLTPK